MDKERQWTKLTENNESFFFFDEKLEGKEAKNEIYVVIIIAQRNNEISTAI